MRAHDRRILILLALLVAGPLGLIGYLAAGLARDQGAARRHHLTRLVEGRLADVRSRVDQAVAAIERELLARIPDPAAAADELRAGARREPLVRHVFVVDGAGRLVFPAAGDDASAEELDFLSRTAAIWNRDAVLTRDPRAEDGTAPVRRRAGAGAGDSVLDLAARADHGWIPWYWEDGLHLLFWRRAPGGGVIGAEVERVALLARVVAALPTGAAGAERIALVDSRGQPVHQWGAYGAPAGAPPEVTLALAPPLDAWRLDHHLAPAERHALTGASRLPLSLGVAAIALALLGLAAYVYREYTRRLREAAQRVGFVTRVSHELRTPLTNIRMYAELLERDLEGDEAAAHKLGVVVSESQRLTRLIDNLLAFGRGGPARPTRREAVDLGEATGAVLRQFAPALEARGIAWSVDHQATRPVVADPDAVGQILANLVSNVEKYAAEGGRLEVTTADRGDHAVVRIADRGPGVPARHRERVFEPFYRISDRLSDGATGTGIGLAIARELARGAGGELSLVERERERGACFELALPAAGVAA